MVLFLFVKRIRKADFQLYLKIVCSKPKSNPIFGIIFKNIGKEMHYDKVSYHCYIDNGKELLLLHRNKSLMMFMKESGFLLGEN